MTRRQAACLAACTVSILAASAPRRRRSGPVCRRGRARDARAGLDRADDRRPVGAAADRQSAAADSFLDPVTQLTLDHVDVGAAGCAGGTAAPGGTSTRATVWRIFGNSVGADTLQADLVPASGDGSGWRLRSHFDGLAVNAKPPPSAWGRPSRSELGVTSARRSVSMPAPGRRFAGGARRCRSA